MANLEITNKIIIWGLVYKKEFKICKRYLLEGRVTRCFNCQRYKHISRKCRHPAACANCAGNHTTNKYTKDPEERRKYIIYKRNHKVGSIHYTVEYKQREIAATIRNITSLQYQYQSSQSAQSVRTILQTPPRTTTQATNQTQTQTARNSAIPIASNYKGHPT